jgi:hypothetical protein
LNIIIATLLNNKNENHKKELNFSQLKKKFKKSKERKRNILFGIHDGESEVAGKR